MAPRYMDLGGAAPPGGYSHVPVVVGLIRIRRTYDQFTPSRARLRLRLNRAMRDRPDRASGVGVAPGRYNLRPRRARVGTYGGEDAGRTTLCDTELSRVEPVNSSPSATCKNVSFSCPAGIQDWVQPESAALADLGAVTHPSAVYVCKGISVGEGSV